MTYFLFYFFGTLAWTVCGWIGLLLVTLSEPGDTSTINELLISLFLGPVAFVIGVLFLLESSLRKTV
jgi:hypothetical protein